MIPILYDSNESAFVSNGLCRLRDCISCVVSEERNSIYECTFQYPVSGANYDLIKCGRIIAVIHDDTDDIQPFDIVSFSRPIDGVVTFRAVHISYRQSKMTASGTNVNSLSDAFHMLKSAKPSNPFTYWTDKKSAGLFAAADGVPRSVRQMLGGSEGSILDCYGGEYEWDKWTVKLWGSRGKNLDLAIRYGLNLMNYDEEVDFSETFTSCIPYWVGGDDNAVVKGNVVKTGVASFDGREKCVPLNLTDKFQEKPTAQQLETLAAQLMDSNRVFAGTQGIKVEFTRLQDSPEYESYAELMKCSLCDSINVVFPAYDTSARFKIVKTVYDVLEERFSEMELGSLSTTLSQALGLDNNNVSVSDMKVVQAAADAQGSANMANGILAGMEAAASAAHTTLNGIYATAEDASDTLAEMKDAAEAAETTLTGIYQDAADAKTSATSAQAAAASAQASATQAIADAATAKSSADSAQASANQALANAATAQQAANNAQRDATTANKAANGALTQLSVVEDVVGVLNWIAEHGNYAVTADTEVVPGKYYFTRSGSSPNYTYAVVVNPKGNPHSKGYYELTGTDEAVANYVSSHLALTNQGLWVINDNSSYKILLSSTGMKVYDAQGILVATFGESISFSSTRPQYIGNNNSYIVFDPTGSGSLTIGGASILMGTQTLEEVFNNYSTTSQMNKAIGDAVDGIEVGGRNYIRNTGTFDGWTNCGSGTAGTFNGDGTYTFPSTSADGWTEIRPNNNVSYTYIKDCEVVLSAEVKGTNGQTISVMLNPYLSASATGDRTKYRNVYLAVDGGGVSQKTVTADGTWQKVYAIVTINDAFFSSGSGSGDYFGLRAARLNTNHNSYSIRKIKLEKGNKATDWSPAPEDVQAEIDAKKSVHTLNTSYSYTYANILTYSAEGFSSGWNIASSAGVKSGDTVRLKVTVSDMGNAPVYIVGTVTAVNSTTNIAMTSHGLDTTIIDGGNILTNSIGANQIQANSINTSKLAVGDWTNLVTANELYPNSLPTSAVSISNGYLVKTTATNQYMLLTKINPRTPNNFKKGDELYVEFYAKAASATTAVFSIFAYDSSNTYLDGNSALINGSTSTTTFNIPTTETKFTGTITLTRPAWDTAAYYEIDLNNNASTKVQIYMRKVVVRKKSAGELIVDGSITTDKLAANSITVGKMNSDTQSQVLNSNIEVGGRNILVRTYASVSKATTATTSYVTQNLYYTPDKKMLSELGYKTDDEVTLSFDWTIANATTYGNARIEWYGYKSDSSTDTYIAPLICPFATFSASNTSGRVETTVKLTSATVKAKRILLRIDNSSLTLTISNVKLEKGNKATDWSPAPEDVQSGIDAARTTATSYITDIDSNNGIRIHSSSTENNSIIINSKGMEVFKGGTTDEYSVAKYGDTARIGAEASRHIEISESGFDIYQNNVTAIASVSYGTGAAESGTAEAPYYILGSYLDLSPAPANYSISGGVYSEALGYCSRAIGYYVKTNYAHQTAIGKFNSNNSNNAFEIGWGTSSTRKNIFEVTNAGVVKANGVSISSTTRTAFTPTSGASYSGYGGCYYEKYGNVVHVHVGISGLTANTATNIATLPAGYRPYSMVCAHGTGSSWDNLGYLQVSTDGVVMVRSEGTYCGADVTFIV